MSTHSNSSAAIKLFAGELANKFDGQFFLNELLSRHTYFKTGGSAAILVRPSSTEDLLVLRDLIAKNGLTYVFLGAGSNVLVSDAGFDGVVIDTTVMNISLREVSSNELEVGSSVKVSKFLQNCAKFGWSGFEFLAGIPGSIGGVLVMNAGTHLGEVKSVVKSIQIFDFNKPNDGKLLVELELDETDFEYRNNKTITRSQLIWSAVFRCQRSDPLTVDSQIKTVLDRRKKTQPLNQPSCGSVFRNPALGRLKAWQVVEKLGLRGYRIGGSAFSEKHCNFIVNEKNACSSDIKALIDLAKSRAVSELGIELHEEVRYIGF